MRAHHINCGTLHPPSTRVVHGEGSLFGRATMVCHCLLVETDDGLVLVDTGLGMDDVQDPKATLSAVFRTVTRPVLDPEETALRQVQRLGHKPEDVRHIVLTHLDVDHAGGLRDFPWAKVHVHQVEHQRALNPVGSEKQRYIGKQWAHGPDWQTYTESGDRWFGFGAVRQLNGLPPEILLVPLAGHSHGHTAVAVDTGEKWLLHAGDAYMFHGETDPVRPRSTPGLAAFQNLMQVDGLARRENQRRLRELRANHGDEVEIFSAHDHSELAAYL
ncbi:MBL fold metallo-hydrolase [Allokutzneria multivorans]|uniref:MBL fold metallo-hydrolase n=1 Tax=Allokutzneria multivorans TaxID=1142134 RepID=UPI0031EA72C3